MFLALTTVSLSLSAQATIDLGRKFVGKSSTELFSILNDYGTYYQVHNSEKKKTVVSVEVDDAVYVYKILHSDKQVIINYRHDNKQHLLELDEVKRTRNYNKIHSGSFSTDVTLE
jgi:hypothetical protein